MPDALSTQVLAEVAAGGAADAGGLRVELLGDFLEVLSAAVIAGAPISAKQLRTYRTLGDAAARDGVALRALLDLYLSAAWRLWRHLPPVANAAKKPSAVVVAGEVMLHAVDDVVAALAEGYQLARRSLVRAEESTRREFVDDLLNGARDVASLLERASGFGMDFAGPHAVVTVRSDRPFDDSMPVIRAVERAILGRMGDAHALVASKAGRLVVVFAAPDRVAIRYVVDRIGKALGSRRSAHWQVGVGRPGRGAAAVVSSYREALEALELADRIGLTDPVVDARDLLVYQVLLRDRGGLLDLVEDTLAPLRSARGGAQPLLDTLSAYFEAGGNAAACGRSLHLSVRAVTYRLGRVRALTALDPSRPDDRFTLQVAVLGARLLDW